MQSAQEPIHLNSILADAKKQTLDVTPKRVALTINCLIPIRLNDTPTMLYYNFDPINWNQWYPIFTSFHADMDSEIYDPGEMVLEAEKHSSIRANFTDEAMRAAITRSVVEELKVDTVELHPKPVLERDFWLKYSATRHVWTLYAYYFYCAIVLEPMECLGRLLEPRFALVPIGATEYNGIKVVENTYSLLENPDKRAFVEASAMNYSPVG